MQRIPVKCETFGPPSSPHWLGTTLVTPCRAQFTFPKVFHAKSSSKVWGVWFLKPSLVRNHVRYTPPGPNPQLIYLPFVSLWSTQALAALSELSACLSKDCSSLRVLLYRLCACGRLPRAFLPSVRLQRYSKSVIFCCLDRMTRGNSRTAGFYFWSR